eukprot:1124297-Rhodomonas_salina.1
MAKANGNRYSLHRYRCLERGCSAFKFDSAVCLRGKRLRKSRVPKVSGWGRRGHAHACTGTCRRGSGWGLSRATDTVRIGRDAV